MAGIKNDFPKIGEILISERDQYLAAKIKEAPGQKGISNHSQSQGASTGYYYNIFTPDLSSVNRMLRAGVRVN